jgi:hypothetical protein
VLCDNKRRGLEAEATFAGGWWTVDIYRDLAFGDGYVHTTAKDRNRDEALAAAVALLPRRRIAR